MISQGQFLGHPDSGGLLESHTHLYTNMESEEDNASDQIGNNNVGELDSQLVEIGPPTLLPEVPIARFRDSEQSCSQIKSASRNNHDYDLSDSDVELDADKIGMGDVQNDDTGSGNESDYVIVRGGMKTRGNRRPIMLSERMRQKRQTLQDMARPLKAWLYEHRDNPYPTKTEKMVLAVGSQMTLVQVSNWFANARRRLKNTVRQPGLTWSKRIKMYNSHVTGNAERLSISSTSSSIYDGELQEEHSFDENPPLLNCFETTSNISSIAPSTTSQNSYLHTDCQSTYPEGAQQQYKDSIMNRYLNDSYEHAQRYHHHTATNRRRNGSGTGSVSSHDYEDVSLSRLSPGLSPHSEEESNDISGHSGSAFFEDSLFKDLKETVGNSLPVVTKVSRADDETYWKEIIAAVALTNMARASRQQRPIITL